MIVVLLLLSLLAMSEANFVRKRQMGSSMIDGHEVLVNRYWANTPASANCTGVPYDSTEVDITDGMTCLTFGSLSGYYFQKVPDNTTFYRRCVTDNLSCMTNANETCTVFPVPLGKCFLATTKLMEGTAVRDVQVWTTTTIEMFKTVRGTKRKIAIEELYPDEKCAQAAQTTKEIWPDSINKNTTACVADASKKSYRAFHNSYDDKVVRICDYAPDPTNLTLSCEMTPYICHVYSNGGCADYPFGGSFKIYLRDAPNPPAIVPASAATLRASGVAVLLLAVATAVLMA